MAKMTKGARKLQRAQRKSDRADKKAARGGGTDMAGLAGGVLGAVGTFGPMISDIGMDSDARMAQQLLGRTNIFRTNTKTKMTALARSIDFRSGWTDFKRSE